MIICKTCGEQYEDDTDLATCSVCDAPLEKPGAATPPVALVSSSDAPSRPEEPATFWTRESSSRPSGEETDRDRPQTPSFESARPRTESTVRARPVPRILDEEDEKLDADYLETLSAYDRKQAIVTVIGFSGSGKTFWVNRLRDELPNRFWRSSEPAAEEILKSPAGIELTRFVPPASEGRSSRPYLMVDCAGESFVQAMETQDSTRRLEGASVRSYLVALAFASAYVLVIRAEDLFAFREESTLEATQTSRKLRSVVNGFYRTIGAMVVARERLARQKAAEFLRQGISREELDKIFERSHLRCSQPIYVALAQADKLVETLGGEGLEADPFLFALRRGRKLFNAIHQSFDHYRFDFLSAFYGHDGSTKPNYGDEHYGAVDAFEWIHRHVRPHGSRLSFPWRYAKGEVPTRHVVGLRRKLDPVFRQVWEER